MGTRVVNNVTIEGELFPDVARRGDTEVELSRADPTRGSLLVFCQDRSASARVLGNDPISIRGGIATHKLPPQVLYKAHEDRISHCEERSCDRGSLWVV